MLFRKAKELWDEEAMDEEAPAEEICLKNLTCL